MNKNAGKNNASLFSQIVDYYSTTDKYIRNRARSSAHQTVFTKKTISTSGLCWNRKASVKLR